MNITYTRFDVSLATIERKSKLFRVFLKPEVHLMLFKEHKKHAYSAPFTIT
jgi:hypothetical protein